MYKAKDSIYKEAARDLILRRLRKHVGEKEIRNCITLPNLNFSLEERILKLSNEAKMDCYEIDHSTYLEAKEKKPTSIQLKNQDVFLCDKEKPYSFIWLDFCNSYTEGFINKIAEFLSKVKFDKKAIFAVTLMKNRGTILKKNKFSKYYKDYKEKGIVYHLGSFIEGCVAAEKAVYSCKDVAAAASTMNVFIFK